MYDIVFDNCRSTAGRLLSTETQGKIVVDTMSVLNSKTDTTALISVHNNNAEINIKNKLIIKNCSTGKMGAMFTNPGTINIDAVTSITDSNFGEVIIFASGTDSHINIKGKELIIEKNNAGSGALFAGHAKRANLDISVSTLSVSHNTLNGYILGCATEGSILTIQDVKNTYLNNNIVAGAGIQLQDLTNTLVFETQNLEYNNNTISNYGDNPGTYHQARLFYVISQSNITVASQGEIKNNDIQGTYDGSFIYASTDNWTNATFKGNVVVENNKFLSNPIFITGGNMHSTVTIEGMKFKKQNGLVPGFVINSNYVYDLYLKDITITDNEIGDGVLVNSTGNMNNIYFSGNCEISNNIYNHNAQTKETTNSLFSVKSFGGTLKITDGIVKIYNNKEATSTFNRIKDSSGYVGGSIIDLNNQHDFEINNALLDIQNNTVYRNSQINQSFIKLLDSSSYMPSISLIGTGSIIIKDNNIDTSNYVSTQYKMSAIYLAKKNDIEIENGSITVSGNKAIGTNADIDEFNKVLGVYKITNYNVYSDDTATGFIKQKTDTKIDGVNTYIDSIAFSTGTDVIYSSWTEDNVSGFTDKLYKKDFVADTKAEEDLSVEMYTKKNRKDVVIKYGAHEHYMCGTATDSECTHTLENSGIESHSASPNKEDYIIDYEVVAIAMVKNDDNDWVLTEGAYALKEDIILKRVSSGDGFTIKYPVNLTGNLHICLNGHKLKFHPLFIGDYTVSICNCNTKSEADLLNDAKEPALYDGSSMFSKVTSAYIMSAVKPINYVTRYFGNIVDSTNVVTKLYCYNLKITPHAGYDAPARVSTDELLVISSCSISRFNAALNSNRSYLFTMNGGDIKLYNTSIDNCRFGGTDIINYNAQQSLFYVSGDNNSNIEINGKFTLKDSLITRGLIYNTSNGNYKFDINAETLIKNVTLRTLLLNEGNIDTNIKGDTTIDSVLLYDNSILPADERLYYPGLFCNIDNGKLNITSKNFVIKNTTADSNIFINDGYDSSSNANLNINVASMSIINNTIEFNDALYGSNIFMNNSQDARTKVYLKNALIKDNIGCTNIMKLVEGEFSLDGKDIIVDYNYFMDDTISDNRISPTVLYTDINAGDTYINNLNVKI